MIFALKSDVFAQVFNVKKITGRYDLLVKNEKGKYIVVEKNVLLSTRPFYTESCTGHWVSINGENVIKITEVVSYNSIMVDFTKASGVKKPKWLKENTLIKVQDSTEHHFNYTYGKEMFDGHTDVPIDVSMDEYDDEPSFVISPESNTEPVEDYDIPAVTPIYGELSESSENKFKFE